MKRLLFLLASGRSGGNSELMATHAIAQLGSQADFVIETLVVNDYPLPAFKDYRQSVLPADIIISASEETLLAATLRADAIFVVAPVYWYSLPANIKLYFDYWSTWMRLPAVQFREQVAEKSLAYIGAMASADESDAQALLTQLRLTTNYMSMNWLGAALACGVSESGEVLQKQAPLQAATALVQRALLV